MTRRDKVRHQATARRWRKKRRKRRGVNGNWKRHASTPLTHVVMTSPALAMSSSHSGTPHSVLESPPQTSLISRSSRPWSDLHDGKRDGVGCDVRTVAITTKMSQKASTNSPSKDHTHRRNTDTQRNTWKSQHMSPQCTTLHHVTHHITGKRTRSWRRGRPPLLPPGGPPRRQYPRRPLLSPSPQFPRSTARDENGRATRISECISERIAGHKHLHATTLNQCTLQIKWRHASDGALPSASVESREVRPGPKIYI